MRDHILIVAGVLSDKVGLPAEHKPEGKQTENYAYFYLFAEGMVALDGWRKIAIKLVSEWLQVYRVRKSLEVEDRMMNQ